MRAIDIPPDLKDVSPEWMSAALATEFPGVRVASVRPESLHEGTASTSRLHLEYAAPGPPGPKTMCIKCDFGLPHRENVTRSGIYRKEAIVYLDVLPKTSARVAGCYAATYDEAGRGLMLLQDLGPLGGRFCDPVSGLTVAQVAVGVGELAKLHAATWNAPWLNEPQWMHHGKPLSEEDPFWNAIFDHYADRLEVPHAGAMAKIFWDRDVVKSAFNRLRTFDDKIARSLIHGDAHVGNFFVDKNGDPGMADFQCVQRGHFTHDLATFMVSALDVADRRAHEKALLQHYLGCLADLGVEAPDFEEAWLGYRRHLIYSLTVWLFTTDTFQPQLHLVTNIFRYGIAALDLDSLGALQ